MLRDDFVRVSRVVVGFAERGAVDGVVVLTRGVVVVRATTFVGDVAVDSARRFITFVFDDVRGVVVPRVTTAGVPADDGRDIEPLAPESAR